MESRHNWNHGSDIGKAISRYRRTLGTSPSPPLTALRHDHLIKDSLLEVLRIIHELLDFTQSHNGLDDLEVLSKLGCGVEDRQYHGADTDDPRGLHSPASTLCISLLTEGLLKLYGSKAVTVDNVVLDKLRGHRGEVRLTNVLSI